MRPDQAWQAALCVVAELEAKKECLWCCKNNIANPFIDLLLLVTAKRPLGASVCHTAAVNAGSVQTEVEHHVAYESC